MKDDKYFVLLCLHFDNGYTERTERYRKKKKGGRMATATRRRRVVRRRCRSYPSPAQIEKFTCIGRATNEQAFPAARVRWAHAMCALGGVGECASVGGGGGA